MDRAKAIEGARKLAPQGSTILAVRRGIFENNACFDFYSLFIDGDGKVYPYYLTGHVAALLDCERNGKEQIVIRGTYHPDETVELFAKTVWNDEKTYTLRQI